MFMHRIVLPLVLSLAMTTSAIEQDAAAQPPREPGVSVRFYDIGARMDRVPDLVRGQTPNVSVVLPTLNLRRVADFHGLTEWFVVEVDGFINIAAGKAGLYEFQLYSDDGALLYIRDQLVIDHDGLHSPSHREGQVQLEAGEHPFRVRYFQGQVDAVLSLRWRPPGEATFTVVPTEVLTCQKGEVRVTSPGRKQIVRPLAIGAPGDRRPLEGVHPSYDLQRVRPSGFRPRVGGIDWLSDGRMVLCTWDPAGAVYILDGVQGDDPEAVKVHRFAAGLAEPLGLKVVDDRIFVLQKQELTELIDNDGDGVADEYRAVCAGWNVTSNFHEFAFGLAYKDGYFYGNLAIAINPGGASTRPQVPERGGVLKINPRTGTYEIIAHGLRTPNGIGIGVDGEIFITDNQGDWVPVSTLVHLKPDAFYGSRAVMDEDAPELPVQEPVVWLPQGEIGNSPSQPAWLNDGPYRGQMVHGDVTHGGLKRVFVEKIDGDYQGAVFRFTQGLEAGVNRISWGPDGALYIGGIGSTGNWGQEGKLRYGLERIKYNGKPTFEMLAVRAMANGLEIEFTQPLAFGLGWDPSEYRIERFRYRRTANYGGPKIDQQQVPILSASVSSDRRRVFLEFPEGSMKPLHVFHVLLAGEFRSDESGGPWTTEAWYTLNRVPRDRLGVVNRNPPLPPHNTLSQAEQAAGWMLLFDGKTLDAWRGFGRDDVPDGWQIVDGALTRVGPGGDIITRETFENFELSLDWRIAPGGNSGIFYHVQEQGYSAVWQTGPEMQILDNAGHPDGQDPSTSAGANYALHAPIGDTTRPVGAYNRAKIVVRGKHTQYWLNGVKVVEFEKDSDDWKKRVAASKFAQMRGFGRYSRGHIALQDHGDRVQFRNIKIRRLD